MFPDVRPSFAVLSTFPPTACGIATFTAALCDGLAAHGADVSVLRLGDRPSSVDPRIVLGVDDGTPAARRDVAAALDAHDVAIVQHEYGIYAGPDGDAVVDIVEQVTVPTIVVAHTVLEHPTANQRAVLEAVAAAADVVVVMTEAGRLRLAAGFDVDDEKVVVIPHGAAVHPSSMTTAPPDPGALLTWGLLGPGKGIEWAIDALALLDDVRPPVSYRIAGATHPKVLAHEGEAYRDMLVARAERHGLRAHVDFDAGYRGLDALAATIRRSSIVVLPYDSPDQVTSGVLVDAVAAGRPVIATAFPHAVELLASGAGIVVPRQDPAALAAAIRRVLTEPGLADRMAAEARRIGPDLAWSAVAARYARLGDAIRVGRQAVSA